jgi:anaerobic selenocysteine-containing dehydrogenase
MSGSRGRVAGGGGLPAGDGLSRRGFLARGGACAAGLALGGGLPVWLRGSGAAARPAGTAAVEEWSRSACDLCGLAEPVFVGAREGRIADVKGIGASRSGFGRLCPRARALAVAAVTGDRAVSPLLRRDPATKGTLEGLEPAGWDEAIAAIAERLADVRSRLGPGGVALLASDAETCETYLRLARVARAGLGTDHVDTPARLDALHAYDACRDAFGVPANPSSVEDVDAAELLVLVGGDLADSHPALFTRVLDARRTGRARVALIDSRKTLAAGVADLHLRPRPGGELILLDALARGDAAPEGAAPLLAMWRGAERILTLVGLGSLAAPTGTAVARTVTRLHRESGQWGGPGRGVLFLPRGAGATAVVAAGARPGALPAGRTLADAADRATVAGAWGVEPDALPAGPGLSLLRWPAAAESGALGAIIALRANPAAELPDAGAWRRALKGCFVVAATTHVPTETTVFADVVLPLALVTGESSGTVMSLDRRVQSIERAAAPPGQARDADRILDDLARAVLDPETHARLFPDTLSEWETWRALAQGTPFEAGGIPFARLRERLDVPWPCATEDDPGAVRITPGLVAAPPPLPSAGPRPRLPAAPGGLTLLTGPVAEHAASRVRTGRTPELHYEAPAARLEMHPDDGGARQLADGEWVAVESATGTAAARLWLTDRVTPGTVFLPEHFGFLSDLQGGSFTQKEPEGLAHLLTSLSAAPDESPSGLQPAVTVRRALRGDLRRRGP